MEYGSIFGHGAYLGPDWTADYLHRSALSVEDQYGGGASDSARQQERSPTSRRTATTPELARSTFSPPAGPSLR